VHRGRVGTVVVVGAVDQVAGVDVIPVRVFTSAEKVEEQLRHAVACPGFGQHLVALLQAVSRVVGPLLRGVREVSLVRVVFEDRPVPVKEFGVGARHGHSFSGARCGSPCSSR
jgi:hypothetical protein